jgi:plastocyanin
MNRTYAFVALVLAALTAATGCGDDSEEATAAKSPRERATVLKIRDTSAPGTWSFDRKRLTANAGRVTIELQNASGLGHNVRVHTGKCCFKPGYKDLGGTEVIGATSSDRRDTVRATLDLRAGTYTFLCSLPGHYQTGQHGTLVVN